MQIEEIPVILILGIISLFFLITGIKGLIHGRMEILNPFADIPPSSMTDVVFNILKSKIETDYPVPDNFAYKGNTIEITGNAVLVRAWFNIILGILILFVMAFFLKPALFEWVLDWLL